MSEQQKEKCPYCDQEMVSDGTISIHQMRVMLAYELYKKAMAALKESSEPTVIEQARLALETIEKI